MIRLVVNSGQFELSCRSFRYGYGSPLNLGGNRPRLPPDYILVLEFEGEAPKELMIVGKTGTVLDSIMIYPNETLPVGLEFLFVIVDSIDHKYKIGEKLITVVNMRALRIESTDKTPFGDIKVKSCINCGRNIHYNYVVSTMINWLSPLTPLKVFKLWNSDLIDFYCCTCYSKWCKKNE